MVLCYAILFQESLGYRLTGSEGDIGSWGHEYVRNLAGEIAEEYTMRQVRNHLVFGNVVPLEEFCI